MEKTRKSTIIQGLTPTVKPVIKGSQLQGFRSFQGASGEWFYELRFFPGPRKGCFLFREEGSGGISLFLTDKSEEKQIFTDSGRLKPDPVQLYIRAHLLNRRLSEDPVVREEAGGGRSLELHFEGAATVLFSQESRGQAQWSVEISIPEKKAFRRQIRILKLALPDGGLSETKAEIENPAPKKAQKYRRLLSQVEADLAESRELSLALAHLCEFLEENPSYKQWPPKGLEIRWARLIDSQCALEALASQNKKLKDEVFRLRRRYERKVEGAMRRLNEVRSMGVEEIVLPSERDRSSSASGKKASVGPGRRVEHPSGFVALVGKKASENAQLFRQAHPRDFWFHVRGVPGAHVWIPRFQKGVLEGQELGANAKKWGAQLALYNSKAASSGYGVVDYTEKRYLKSAKGQAEGTLLIQRSETLSTELDESFYERLGIRNPYAK